MKYVSASNIVSNICAIHLDDEQQRNAGRVIRTLGIVLSEFAITAGMTIVSKDFVLQGNTLKMPDDCVEVFKVGVICNGHVRMMGSDNTIKAGCSCEGSDTCAGCTFYNYVSGSLYKGEMYGRRAPQFENGTYRWDTASGRIEFGSGYDVFDGSKIIVEYRSSLTEDVLDVIPAHYELAITHKVLAHFFAVSNPSAAQFNMREFQRHFAQLKRNDHPFQLNEFLAAIRGNRVSSPR